ncbi:MAG: undecaprenyl-diphosphate phosphatase [Symbiobacteriia bacterium]
MTVLQALIMGLLQGLGEFLPISSSAHLTLFPWVMKWTNPELNSLTFDVALHLGTLIAVVGYFWRDWLSYIFAGLSQPSSRNGRIFWYLVVASVPGAIIGFLLEDKAATVFRTPALVATMLVIMGLILYWVDSRAAESRGFSHLGLSDSLWIGLSQAFAVIPGVSRSGATMTAGRALGLDREAAARFSFLLSAPIIFGAALVSLRHFSAAEVNLPLLVGILAAAVSGALSISYLLKFLQRNSFLVFAWYRVLAGLAVLALVFVRR